MVSRSGITFHKFFFGLFLQIAGKNSDLVEIIIQFYSRFLPFKLNVLLLFVIET